MSRLRVAIGPAEISWTSSALAEGLGSADVDAELAFWSPLPGPFPTDRALGRVARTLYAVRAPLRRDVLHYQYGFTWIPGRVDAWWARLLRRLRVVSYYGDDCRRADVATRLGWPLAPFKDPVHDASVRRRVEAMGRLCDAAVAIDLEIASYLRPFFRRVYVAPVPLHNRTAGATSTRPERRPLRVLHAPSDRALKGTAMIERAVAEAAQDVPLELVVLSGVGHEAVGAALAEADMVVDQMHSASVSILSLEAMRARLPVLSHVDRRALAPFHEELPVVGVTEETLARELVELAGDEARRRRLGSEGHDYVQRRHEAHRAAAAVLRVYEHARGDATGLFEATADGVRPLPEAW